MQLTENEIAITRNFRDIILNHVSPVKKSEKPDPFDFIVDLRGIQEELFAKNIDAFVYTNMPSDFLLQESSKVLMESRYYDKFDLPELAEYFNGSSEISDAISMKSGQFATVFISMIKINSEGQSDIEKDNNTSIIKLPNGTILDLWQVFEMLNNINIDQEDHDIVNYLLGYATCSCPCFRILINKRYSSKTDNIIYWNRARLNRPAMTLVKQLNEKASKDDNKENK